MQEETLTIYTTILDSDKTFLEDLIKFCTERGWVIEGSASGSRYEGSTHSDISMIRGRDTIDISGGGDDPEDAMFDVGGNFTFSETEREIG